MADGVSSMSSKSYENVHVSFLKEDGSVETVSNEIPFKIEISQEKTNTVISILNGGKESHKIPITSDEGCVHVGQSAVLISTNQKSYLLRFSTDKDDAKKFRTQVQDAILRRQKSVFSERTDDASAEQYFQFYGYLSQQQNMMQDYIRTSTYQRAMLDNCSDFQDKIVLDVGAGSGILSFFAVQAGAKRVYAIEASTMAIHCENLVQNNKLGDKIIVVPGKVEEVDIPEKVDIIISEPMGYMLFNERMLESYLHAKKWLKPNGKMFPTQGDLHVTPFTDEALYMEQFSKANFWYQQSFHGVDLAGLRQAAVKEYFKQPIVDTFDMRICMARSLKYTVDFGTAHETDLHHIEIPVTFTILQSGTVHGLAFWFDVAFIGTETTVWLSTAPTQPLTHWYQVRCLLQNPVFVKQGQTLTGKVVLRANKRQSYDVDIELTVPGTNTKSTNTLDLKNPFFRYTGVQPQPPPGNNHQSPSDAYWSNTDPTVTVGQSVQQTFNVGNGFQVSGLLNGGILDATQVQQQGVVQNNLVPLANMAPINPGSIPTATIVQNQPGPQSPQSTQHIQTRTSIGGGISPTLFQTATQSNSYPVSNQFMIGDYVLPGNIVLPTQNNLGNITVKTPPL